MLNKNLGPTLKQTWSLQGTPDRAHVAVLNAAGKTVAARLGLHIVDFEPMTSRFEKPAHYLAVR